MLPINKQQHKITPWTETRQTEKKKKNPKQETISTQCPARNKCFKERMSDLPGA